MSGAGSRRICGGFARKCDYARHRKPVAYLDLAAYGNAARPLNRPARTTGIGLATVSAVKVDPLLEIGLRQPKELLGQPLLMLHEEIGVRNEIPSI